MSVIAEFSIDTSRLVLERTFDAFPDVRLDLERSVAADPNEPILFVWVDCDDPDGFEAAMGEDPTVSDPELLSEVDSRRLYRLRVSGETEVVLYPRWVDLGAERLEAYYQEGRWHGRTRFPDRDALAAYQSFLSAEGLDFQLKRLYDSDHAEKTTDALTPRQRETLELAYELGFFEVPRRATTSDLAERLGVSNQAISERLRRGYARLVEDALF